MLGILRVKGLTGNHAQHFGKKKERNAQSYIYNVYKVFSCTFLNGLT